MSERIGKPFIPPQKPHIATKTKVGGVIITTLAVVALGYGWYQTTFSRIQHESQSIHVNAQLEELKQELSEIQAAAGPLITRPEQSAPASATDSTKEDAQDRAVDAALDSLKMQLDTPEPTQQ